MKTVTEYTGVSSDQFQVAAIQNFDNSPPSICRFQQNKRMKLFRHPGFGLQGPLPV
jgi:hypothetical protein